MEIREMNIEQVDARLAAIAEEIKSADKEGLNALNAEMDAIEARKAQLNAENRASAVAAIKEHSVPVNGSDDIARVGTVSSGDESIGKLIAEAMEKVGTEGVITIDYNAFLYCRDLESVVIPEGVTTINSGSFYGCTALKSVKLPDSLSTIDTYLFGNCSALTSITSTPSVWHR